ncbi:MAG TPA: FG-GAP-like repeat-containing protein [Polyangiaceae bacterium]
MGGSGAVETGAGGTGNTESCEATCDGACCGEVCVDLESDINHCGVCGVVCDLNQAEEACVAGSCVVTQCWDNAVDCNGVASDGCERKEAGVPETPMPTRPMLGAFTGSLHARDEIGSLRPRFVWSEVEPVTCDVVTYQVQVDDECELESFDDCDFTSPELDVTGIRAETFTPAADLPVEEMEAPLGRRYYWRVRACEGALVCSDWSEVFYVDVGRVREDVTGDGYPDVVGVTEERELFFVRGSADFYDEAEFEMIPTSEMALASEFPHLSFLGDVDGDGFNDVSGVGLDPSRDARAIYVWRGAQAFGAVPEVLVASGTRERRYPSGAWSAGDYDRDGFADLVMLIRPSTDPAAWWILKFGGRTLADSPADELRLRPSDPAPSGTTQVVSTAARGDFNGDGYPDLATNVYPFQEGVAFVLGDVDTDPQIVPVFPSGDVCRPTMATLDFNGDDIDDLGVMCRNEPRLAVVMGRRDFESDAVKVWKVGLETQYADLAAGDIDNSGFDDLIVSDGTTFLGAAEPDDDSADFLGSEKTYEPIVVSDHNADGELDVLRAFHWYIGWVTAETSDKELYTADGEELEVAALAR